MAFDAESAQLANAPAPQAPAQAPMPDPNQDAVTPESMLKDAGKSLFAALHGAADTATFGLTDKASAGLASLMSPATGQPLSYDEALERVKANVSKMNGESPVSAAIGSGAGMLLGAGKIAKAAEMIPGVSGVAQALAPVAGQTIKNVGKAALAAGAASGAYTTADDLARTGSVDPTNTVLNSAVGAVVGPAVSKIGTAMIRGVASSGTKAMALLADKLGETPQVLQKVYDNFSAATGRVPTMAELVGMKSQGELKAIAGNNPIVQDAVNNAADTAASQRPMALSQVIEDAGGGAQDVSQLTKARKANMDASMAPIRNDPVDINDTNVGLLSDPRVRAAVASTKIPELKDALNTAIKETSANGSSDALTVRNMDSIRKAVRNQQTNMLNPQHVDHSPEGAMSMGNLADNLADVVTNGDKQHPYAQALEQFGRDSDYIKGFEHGNAGKTIGEANKQSLIDTLATPEGRAGHQAGIVSRTSDAAASSESGAVRTANDLAQGGGDTAVLRGAVGANGFDQMQRAGAAEAKGAASLQNISGNIPADQSGVSASQAAQAIGSAASHSPTGLIYHASKLIPSFKAQAPAVQKQIARYLADPSMTQQGINLLRKAGARDQEIRKLATALSVNAGLNTAASLGQ